MVVLGKRELALILLGVSSGKGFCKPEKVWEVTCIGCRWQGHYAARTREALEQILAEVGYRKSALGYVCADCLTSAGIE